MPFTEDEKKHLSEFGAKLKGIRLLQGLTMQGLADMAEIEISQIYRLESARINPKLTTIITLCKTLKVNPNALIESFDEKSKAKTDNDQS